MSRRVMLCVGLGIAFALLASPASALYISTDLGVPGDPSVPGSVSPPGVQAPGPLTITGSGSDIWDTYDRGHYWYDSFTGNFLAQVRVDTGFSGTSGDAWRKAGIMVRTDTSAGSAMTFLATTPQQIAFQWRDSAGGGAGWPGAFMPGSPSAGSAPFWLALKRQGNTYTAYWAPDIGGSPGTWSTVNPATDVHTNPGIPSSALVGIAITAHSNGNTATMGFSNFSVQALANPTGRIDPQTPGSANIMGAAYALVPPSGPVQGPVHWELWRYDVSAVPGVMSQWYLGVQGENYPTPGMGTAGFLALRASSYPHQDYLISQISWSNAGGGPGYPPETPFTGDMSTFTVRHVGQVYIPPISPGDPTPRTVTFHDHNDDWAILIVDGSITGINDGAWTDWAGNANHQGARTTLSLTPGWHDFEFWMSEGGGGDNARLLWDYDPVTNSFGGPDVTVPTAYLRYVGLTATELLASGDYNVGDPLVSGVLANIGNRPESFLLQLRVSYQGDTWVSELVQYQGLPEPASCLLLAGGLVALARRRRKAAQR